MGRLNRLRRVPRLVLALGVAGATFGIVTAVQAAIPDSHGTIHGCYQFANAATPKGTLRVIDTGSGEACRFTEKPLNALLFSNITFSPRRFLRGQTMHNHKCFRWTVVIRTVAINTSVTGYSSGVASVSLT